MNYSILQGDCIATMKTLPAGSVQCVVTSPPFYGLRDYGTATWEGGEPECDHQAPPSGGRGSSTLDPTGRHERYIAKLDKISYYKNTCLKCGARRIDSQIGLEETPEAYVAKLVEVFREVRRVLHPTGTLWCNLGDSYASNTKGTGGTKSLSGGGTLRPNGRSQPQMGAYKINHGVKEKDLIGIPWMVAFALRADGWYLRSEIIWAKKAPMPESVTDRPTKAHEQLFLLTKSATYYYDAQAIAEPSVYPDDDRKARSKVDHKRMPNEEIAGIRPGSQTYATRNKRSVWTLGPESYSGAHFATMPTKLVEPCILAGTSAHGCCSACGAPWARVTESERISSENASNCNKAQSPTVFARGGNQANFGRAGDYRSTTTGWQPTCNCGTTDVVPCVVLDCFMGSGTTLAVALKHGRRGIGCELNGEYIELAHDRISKSQPMLFEVTA